MTITKINKKKNKDLELVSKYKHLATIKMMKTKIMHNTFRNTMMNEDWPINHKKKMLKHLLDQETKVLWEILELEDKIKNEVS